MNNGYTPKPNYEKGKIKPPKGGTGERKRIDSVLTDIMYSNMFLKNKRLIGTEVWMVKGKDKVCLSIFHYNTNALFVNVGMEIPKGYKIKYKSIYQKGKNGKISIHK